MATKRMLIDASHPEETRVVVLDGSRLEEYDVESAARRQLKGNIYLAKITRVEPSLQAAFVDYGGNRHGFLAFNEIHPDYYQIPVADREALLAEQVAADRAVEAQDEDAEGGEIAVVDEDDDLERRRVRPLSRTYKIQEVIKRRQIMLVQVAKEERGSKGAALTTYLSLAGRYCVLMPNTSRGGGISRKITALTDRKRLKKILAELEVPEDMAVIVRTAGAGRSKAEIKRDYEYLMRLWSNIRETTLQSSAPALVYEEGSLIKRSIRDLYGRDIEEIIIHGEPEYKIAKEFMKLFIPSHAKRVKPYENDDKPLFQGFHVEEQLEVMHQPVVQLKSGGYIVLNPTEALVSVDVNSGRATRERHIEETALRTNVEAADEIARQLRLRDLAGLVVIDFIDMENQRNQGMVERRLKEAMKNDRARVQLGRISPFGLLELSRQRLRPSLLETSFEVCPHCAGTGMRRTVESTALAILRKIEEEGLRRRAAEVTVTAPPPVAAYLLNQKRRSLTDIERRYQFAVTIASDGEFVGADFRIERTKPSLQPEDETAEAEEVVETEVAAEATPEGAEREEGAKRGRRRRPRRRRRGDEETPVAAEAGGEAEEELAAAEAEAEAAGEGGEGEPIGDEEQSDAAKRRRRRGKRGGRRRGRRVGEGVPADAATPELSVAEGIAAVGHDASEVGADEVVALAEDEAEAAAGGEEGPAEDKDGEDAGSVEIVETPEVVIEETGGWTAPVLEGAGEEAGEGMADEGAEVGEEEAEEQAEEGETPAWAEEGEEVAADGGEEAAQEGAEGSQDEDRDLAIPVEERIPAVGEAGLALPETASAIETISGERPLATTPAPSGEEDERAAWYAPPESPPPLELAEGDGARSLAPGADNDGVSGRDAEEQAGGEAAEPDHERAVHVNTAALSASEVPNAIVIDGGQAESGRDEARRTQVIDLSSNEGRDDERDERRRGWWQKLMP